MEGIIVNLIPLMKVEQKVIEVVFIELKIFEEFHLGKNLFYKRL